MVGVTAAAVTADVVTNDVVTSDRVTPPNGGGSKDAGDYSQSDFQSNPETVTGGIRIDVFWKDDGTRVWTLKDTVNRLDQHDVSPAYSVAPGSWTNRVFDSVNFFDGRCIWIRPDGTKVFNFIGPGTLFQRTMSTPFDISTVGSQTNKSFGASGQLDMWWSVDGTRIWVLRTTTNAISEFAVPTPFDVTSITVVAVATFVLTPDIGSGSARSFQFTADGKTLFAIDGNGVGNLVSWKLSTAFDITTAGSFVQGPLLGTAAEINIPRGLTFNLNQTAPNQDLFVFRDQSSQQVKVFSP